MDPLILLGGAAALYFLSQREETAAPAPYDPDMQFPGTDSPAQLTPKQRDAIRRKRREERDRATVPPPGAQPGTHIANGVPPAGGLPGMIPGMASPSRREHATIVPAGLTAADAPAAPLGTPEEMLSGWWATVESAPGLSGVLTWDFGAVNSGVPGGATWAEFPGRDELVQVVSAARAAGVPVGFRWFVEWIGNNQMQVPGGREGERANILFWMVPRASDAEAQSLGFGDAETYARDAWGAYVASQTGNFPLWYQVESRRGAGRAPSPRAAAPDAGAAATARARQLCADVARMPAWATPPSARRVCAVVNAGASPEEVRAAMRAEGYEV